MVSSTQGVPEVTVAVAGLGAIGKAVVRHLHAGIPGVRLAAVAARDAARAGAWLAELGVDVPTVPLAALPVRADVVVECAPSSLLGEIAVPTLTAGKRLVVLSVGALLGRPELESLAREHGGEILVPTGALIGLDAVRAAAEGTIHAVRMVTRKPVVGLAGAPYLRDRGIDLSGLSAPLRVFSGTARQAAAGFPSNLNVAAALSLAGLGPDRTEVEIWADPTATRNSHRIEVESDAASFSMSIENIPSENPKTGRITAQSVVALLRRMAAPLKIGT
jgi:aspartate dehydrogenase